MASMPISNRTIRVMPENKANQSWAPLLTAAGVAIAVAKSGALLRCLVADVVARLMQCHLDSGPKASFAVIGHGIRFVTDGQSGAGAPCFATTQGASTGEIYLFGGKDKKDGLLAAIGISNVASTRDESKGGLFVTLSAVADCQHVYSVLAMHGGNRGPVGYRSDMGAPADLDAVAFAAPEATPEAPKAIEAPVTEGRGDRAASKREAKRAAKLAKASKPVEAPEGEGATGEIAS